ncbi:MAG: hypothetical protein AUJ47_00275 [Candidatus Marinimicrobia bacterium CG1_02_48_14]|nr:MAG: hypothetical protein AUJ47_00275 [Candidatus Marinimicrobia bacterium CG1_02_48_14]
MAKIVKFGEDVEGYAIPVLNEREIRAAAGILFLMMLFSIQNAAGKGDFLMLKYAVIIFLTDICIRLFISPRFAPSLIIGRFIVRNQTPEYVGAPQKKFAWIIGVILAMTMFVLLVLVNSYSVITGLICMVCLIFLFFESAFGICLGCKVYSWIYKEKAQYCPGEVCDVKSKQAIQKTSGVQGLIVMVFIAYIALVSIFFHGNFVVKPHNLFSAESSVNSD